jgi:hypothetical protein
MSAGLQAGGAAAISMAKSRLADIQRLESEINLMLFTAGIDRKLCLLGLGQLLHELEELEFAHRVAISKRLGSGSRRALK